MRSIRPLLIALALVAVAAPSAGAQALPPSVVADTAFSPPTGISDFDFTPGTSVDAAGGVAVDGERIYTVGETRISSSNPSIGITARRLDGSFDTGFSGDGRMTLDIAATTNRDAGYAIAVLPDRRLRILATTDILPDTASAQQNLDIALIGLLPDGSFDPQFGDGGDGVITFPAGAGNDVPSRMDLDGNGRIAIAGCVISGTSGTSCGTAQDFFVSLRNPDGTAAGFGVAGVRTYNRGGTAGANVTLNDRAVDVTFRPGGGILAFLQVETNPDPNINDWHAVLHAFRDDGTDEGAFSGDGDLDLPVGDPDIIPGGVMAYNGRIYATGAVRSGNNGDAYLVRMNPDGSDLAMKIFDVRGGVVPPEVAVGSQGNDLAVVAGAPPTLVVGGFTTLQEGTAWSATAFRSFEGDLATAPSADRIFDMPRNASSIEQQGTLLGLAAGGENWVAAAGSLLDLNSADTSFGTARLLIDADKECDLAVDVTRPLEIVFDADRPATVDVKVTNVGTKVCSGSVAVGPGYALRAASSPYAFGSPVVTRPLVTGALEPGASQTFERAEVVSTGARKRDDVITFTLTAAGDNNAANNTKNVRAIFRFCDLRIRHTGGTGPIPTEGSRRLEFSVSNLGTSTCSGVRLRPGRPAVLRGSAPRFTVRAGRSATEDVRIRLGSTARATNRITFTAEASDDVDLANNAVTLSLRRVRVGDTDIRNVVGRSVRGRAKGGSGGGLSKKRLRVSRVEVAAYRKAGKRCRWLTKRGTTTLRSCTSPVWLRARGRSSWRITLPRGLRGRATVQSRAVLVAGFPEASFTTKDRNRRSFTAR